MDLPEDKGTYLLIASVAQMKRLEMSSGRSIWLTGLLS